MKRTPFPLLPPIKHNMVSQNLKKVQILKEAAILFASKAEINILWEKTFIIEGRKTLAVDRKCSFATVSAL